MRLPWSPVVNAVRARLLMSVYGVHPKMSALDCCCNCYGRRMSLLASRVLGHIEETFMYIGGGVVTVIDVIVILLLLHVI